MGAREDGTARGRAAGRGTLRGAAPWVTPWVTPLYVGALQCGALATARLPAPRRTALLRAHSTNVANLRAGRWGTLATSAAFVEEPLPVAYGAALLATLGAAEVRWGTARAATVFAAGHIGASLLVYAGLRARRGGARPAPRALDGDGRDGGDGGIAHAVDVGASYGFYATVGALAASLPHRGARAAATGGLLALGAVPVVRRGRTFTDVGHLAALVLGVGMGAVGAPLRGRVPATGWGRFRPAATATPGRSGAVGTGPAAVRRGAGAARGGIASPRGVV
ncbi:rhomboid-like protein [Streptomyces lunalinharesii]|uniref:Rhomboid family intramembrane serine protease n=1 Tax=Streptomyces lunalinharesii TaxID=333384 RepID=A0ABP6DPZ4_9ACTN